MYFDIDITVIWLVFVSVKAGRESLRMVGGRDAQPGEFPYVVRLEYRVAPAEPERNQPLGTHNKFRCTASVLTPTVTLTAGHCCLSLQEYYVVVRYSLTDSRPSENDRFSDVLSFSIPPSAGSFNPVIHFEGLSDVALVTTQPILLSKYARLSAVDYPALYGQPVTLLGHGGTVRGSDYNVTLYLDMPLQVVDALFSKCPLSGYTYFYPSACAVRRCGHAGELCSGDSGGPVLHHSGVVGVNSRGYYYHCDVTNVYADLIIFVPLSSHIDWIADSISKNRNL